MSRAPRAVGVLIAEALLVTGSLHHLDALPIGLELVGHDHRHARSHALAHLRAVADDRDRAVIGDRYEYQRIVRPPVRHTVRAVLGWILWAPDRRKAGDEREPAER
jgi:hypothetical protein